MIRVETETQTPFKVDAGGAVTNNQLEGAPEVRTTTHYFDDHLERNEEVTLVAMKLMALRRFVGPKWAYGAAQTDVNNGFALTPADMNALLAGFVEYVLDPYLDDAGAQTFDIKVKVVSDKFCAPKERY